MWKSVLCLVVLLAWCEAASAQQFGRYVFGVAGPVVVPKSSFTSWNGTSVYAGGGVESRIGGKFAMGGEVGALRRETAAGSFTDCLAAVNPAFHFMARSSRQKVDPFVNGGISVLFTLHAVSTPMIHLGGGLNYRVSQRIGLRGEFRHHAWSPESGSTIHLSALRAGIVLGL